jgi:hypothetical protein
MNFNQSVIETMKKRQSIRTFETVNISDEHQNMIADFLHNEQNLIGPFGGKGKIELIPVTDNVTNKGVKLGTYGFIKNSRAFLVGISENKQNSLVDLAYVFQKLVLYLTEMEIGTCWMGGTFNRKSFEREILLENGEFIPCISPMGYLADKQRFFDKAIRYVAKSDNRKPWDQLFFEDDFDKTLTKEKAGEFERPLEMVRIGPSASNKQPWRLVLSSDQKVCHFYIEHIPNYSAKLGYDMQLLDMGIAMCQFDLACIEQNLHGDWKIEDPKIELPNDQTEYIGSWYLNE